MYNIVPAGAADRAAAVAIITEYLEEIGDPIVADAVNQEVERHTRERSHALLLAMAGDQVAACVQVHPLGSAARFEVKRLYVRSAFRRRGLAQELMRAAERFALDCGGSSICLDTKSRMHEAIALYEALGYEHIAPYHATPFADVFMYKRLEEG